MIVWNIYLNVKSFVLFRPVDINSTISLQLHVKVLPITPFARFSHTAAENLHSKNRWFLVSNGSSHKEQAELVDPPHFNIWSPVDSLFRVAIQVRKANFGVANQNHIPFLQAHLVPCSQQFPSWLRWSFVFELIILASPHTNIFLCWCFILPLFHFQPDWVLSFDVSFYDGWLHLPP